MSKLLSCPFCGSNNVAQGAYGDRISVWCFCGARGPDVAFLADSIDPVTPIKECHAAWNRRAPSPSPAPGVVTDEMVEAFIKASSIATGDTAECVRSGLTAAIGAGGQAVAFQQRVHPWMMACFGPEISADKLERSDRLAEEVLELLQSGGYPRERVAALTDYVYGREIGEPAQEVGGVMVTLAAYCLAHDLDMHECGETELARIWTKVEKIRAKQAAKPTGSALPVAHPPHPADERVVEALALALELIERSSFQWVGAGPHPQVVVEKLRALSAKEGRS